MPSRARPCGRHAEHMMPAHGRSHSLSAATAARLSYPETVLTTAICPHSVPTGHPVPVSGLPHSPLVAAPAHVHCKYRVLAAARLSIRCGRGRALPAYSPLLVWASGVAWRFFPREHTSGLGSNVLRPTCKSGLHKDQRVVARRGRTGRTSHMPHACSVFEILRCGHPQNTHDTRTHQFGNFIRTQIHAKKRKPSTAFVIRIIGCVVCGSCLAHGFLAV